MNVDFGIFFTFFFFKFYWENLGVRLNMVFWNGNAFVFAMETSKMGPNFYASERFSLICYFLKPSYFCCLHGPNCETFMELELSGRLVVV